jgi:hypothetical protein
MDDDLGERAAKLFDIETARRKREPGCDDDRPAQKPSPNKPEFIPLADFIAGPPSSSYLIKTVLPSAGLGQVFGSSNVGKSFLLIDLAMHLAAGKEWRGFKTKKIPVLYIAAEGMGGLALRMKAWTLHYGTVPAGLYVRPYSAQLTVAGAAASLAERIESLPTPPKLIILDTLAANFGPGSENDAEDMGLAMNGLRTLAGDWFALCVHHSGHADKTRSRGHSSLYAALDIEIQVDRPDPLGPIKVMHTKCRDMERMDPLFFNLEGVPLPWADEDGEPLHSAVLVPDDAYQEPEKAPSLTRPARFALESLRVLCDASSDGWAFIADWRKAALAAGITNSETKQARYAAFNRALDALEKAHLVEHSVEKWRPIA